MCVCARVQYYNIAFLRVVRFSAKFCYVCRNLFSRLRTRGLLNVLFLRVAEMLENSADALYLPRQAFERRKKDLSC